jgi:hypothetical protein
MTVEVKKLKAEVELAKALYFSLRDRLEEAEKKQIKPAKKSVPNRFITRQLKKAS